MCVVCVVTVDNKNGRLLDSFTNTHVYFGSAKCVLASLTL